MTETITNPTTVVTPVAPVIIPPQIVTMPKSTFDSSDRRKDYALWILCGGGIAMTLYAIAVLWLVQHDARYAYYLGLAAMLNILVLFSGIAGLLVKRTMNISKAGIQIEDHDSKDQSS